MLFGRYPEEAFDFRDERRRKACLFGIVRMRLLQEQLLQFLPLTRRLRDIPESSFR